MAITSYTYGTVSTSASATTTWGWNTTAGTVYYSGTKVRVPDLPKQEKRDEVLNKLFQWDE